jgi:hypothetical protein
MLPFSSSIFVFVFYFLSSLPFSNLFSHPFSPLSFAATWLFYADKSAEKTVSPM